ncbi:MAG: hypothetical protein NTU58_01535 [Candidatus Nealsonbacteria bacterium]|nr:hypothetical protein [Candidatus Nealsonbacteria bacterium]
MIDEIDIDIKIAGKYQETIKIPRIFTSEDRPGNKKEIALCYKKGENSIKDAVSSRLLEKILEEEIFSDVFTETVSLAGEEYLASIMSIFGSRNQEQAKNILQYVVERFDQRMPEAISAFDRIFKRG